LGEAKGRLAVWAIDLLLEDPLACFGVEDQESHFVLSEQLLFFFFFFS